MTLLSVNINKIALIRNARGGNNPDLLQVALDCIRFGADGITVHPRPDGRHIRREDVYQLKEKINVELNVEGYPSPDFLKMVCEIKPAQCTLVPDPPDALTSNAGWNTIDNQSFLKEVIAQLKQNNIRVSIFTETRLDWIDNTVVTGTDRIELYTGPYAENCLLNNEKTIETYKIAAIRASELGLGLNAGHDLNLHNLAYFHQQIPQLQEVSIGHALICDALYLGLEKTIALYKQLLQ